MRTITISHKFVSRGTGIFFPAPANESAQSASHFTSPIGGYLKVMSYVRAKEMDLEGARVGNTSLPYKGFGRRTPNHPITFCHIGALLLSRRQAVILQPIFFFFLGRFASASSLLHVRQTVTLPSRTELQCRLVFTLHGSTFAASVRFKSISSNPLIGSCPGWGFLLFPFTGC